MIDVIWLSVIQGITEFLPISSSAHLILYSKYFNFNNQNLTLDVSLHIGSLLAVIFFFKKEIRIFFFNKKLFLMVIISSLPTLTIGYILIFFNLIENLRNVQIIGWATLIFGIILLISDFKSEKKNIKSDFSFNSALIIGFFQTLSLIPGVSRSGITITTARFLCFDRSEAAKISFLLSIPILVAISFYNIQKIIIINNYALTIQNYSGIFLSFIVSLLTIKYFIKYLKKFTLLFFVIYRVLLGAIILITFYL